MPNWNQTIVMGHLTRDPDYRQTAKGTALAAFGIAVNDYDKTTTFIDCTAWGRAVETMQRFNLVKGSPCMVIGRLKQENWTDKTTGANRSKIGLQVYEVQLTGGKGDGQPRQEQAADPFPLTDDGPGSVPF